MLSFQVVNGYTAFTMTGGSLQVVDCYIAMRYFVVASNAAISITNTTFFETDFVGNFKNCSITISDIDLQFSNGILAENSTV
jgi:hypothetical protein